MTRARWSSIGSTGNVCAGQCITCESPDSGPTLSARLPVLLFALLNAFAAIVVRHNARYSWMAQIWAQSADMSKPSFDFDAIKLDLPGEDNLIHQVRPQKTASRGLRIRSNPSFDLCSLFHPVMLNS